MLNMCKVCNVLDGCKIWEFKTNGLSFNFVYLGPDYFYEIFNFL